MEFGYWTLKFKKFLTYTFRSFPPSLLLFDLKFLSHTKNAKKNRNNFKLWFQRNPKKKKWKYEIRLKKLPKYVLAWKVRNNGHDNVNKPSPNDDQWTSKYQSRKFLNIIKHDLKTFKRIFFLDWMKIKKNFYYTLVIYSVDFFVVFVVVAVVRLVVFFITLFKLEYTDFSKRFQWIITIIRLSLFWSFNFGQFQFNTAPSSASSYSIWNKVIDLEQDIEIKLCTSYSLVNFLEKLFGEVNGVHT